MDFAIAFGLLFASFVSFTAADCAENDMDYKSARINDTLGALCFCGFLLVLSGAMFN